MNRVKKIQKKVGLDFQPNIEILYNPKKEKKIIKQLGKSILLFLCTLGILGCFLSAFHIVVLDLLYISIFVGTIFFAVLYCFPKYLFYFYIGYNLLYITGIWRNFDKIKEGILTIGSEFVEKANAYFEVNYIFEYSVTADNGEAVTIFLFFFLVGFMEILAYIIFLKREKILYFVLTLPFILIGFTIGLVPDLFSLVCYTIATIAILGNKTASGQIFLLLVGFSLFLMITYTFPEKTYQEKVHIEDLKKEIQEVMKGTRNLSIPVLNRLPFLGGQAFGGLSAGRIGNVDKVVFRNKTMLQVNMPFDSLVKNLGFGNDRLEKLPFYLKGFVGSSYEGNKWTGLSKEDQKRYEALQKEFEENGICIENTKEEFLSIIEQEALKENLREATSYLGKIKIKNIEIGNKYTFVPYSIKESIEIAKNGKIQLKQKELQEEGLTYHINLDYIIKNESIFRRYYLGNREYLENNKRYKNFKDLEEKYRKFAYEVYTKLPEDRAKETIETIQLFGRLNGTDLSEADNMEKIANVQKYLEENTEYTLEPGKVPEGKDFVDYFLFESRKGYCSYYATAAVVMLRALNVPTRYVEGFIITQKDVTQGTFTEKDKKGIWVESIQGLEMRTSFLNMNIKDTNAHAWVEVYMDGYGWIPIEVTKGYIFNNALMPPETDLEENTLPRVQTTNVDDKKEDNKKEEIGSTAAPLQNKTAEGNKKDNLFWIKILSIIFISCILGICILLLRRWFILIGRKRRRLNPNSNKKILNIFQEINHMLEDYESAYKQEPYQEYSELVARQVPFVKEEEFREYLEIILKSRFGKEEISLKDCKWVENYYESFREQMYKNAKNKWKKFYYKYIAIY